MLVYEGKAKAAERANGNGQSDVLAVNLETAARIRMVKARQNFNQGGLARAILAQQTVNFARGNAERDAV
jgi:hypothetical protein